MPSIDRLRNTIVTEYYDNSVLMNIAMNVESFLCDDAMIYPYSGWETGEIISGPYLKKYYVTVILRFDYENMPDPNGGKVLQKYGVVVKYKKLYEVTKVKDGDDIKDKVWYVQLDIPKALVSDEKQRDELKAVENMLDIETIAEIDEAEEGSEFDDDNFGGSDFDSDFGDADMGDADMGGQDEAPEPNEEEK